MERQEELLPGTVQQSPYSLTSLVLKLKLGDEHGIRITE